MREASTNWLLIYSTSYRHTQNSEQTFVFIDTSLTPTLSQRERGLEENFFRHLY